MYATQQDILDRYGEDALYAVADLDGDDALDQPRIDQALADAAEEIDLYVGRRESLPLTTIPPILTRLGVDMALYRLSTEATLTDEKTKRYERAVATLKDIANGTVSLGLDTPDAEDASPVANEVEFEAEPRLFKRGPLGSLL